MKRVALLICLSPFAFAQDINLPHTLSNNSVANADQVMANFNALKDGFNSRVSVDMTNENVVLGNGLQANLPDTQLYQYSGKYNSAFGFNTLLSDTGGGENTALGGYALKANTTGRKNTSVGVSALAQN